MLPDLYVLLLSPCAEFNILPFVNAQHHNVRGPAASGAGQQHKLPLQLPATPAAHWIQLPANLA
jgi:hypothetical protein